MTISFPRVHDDVPKHPPVFTACLLINANMCTFQKTLYTDPTQLLSLLVCILSCYDIYFTCFAFVRFDLRYVATLLFWAQRSMILPYQILHLSSKATKALYV